MEASKDVHYYENIEGGHGGAANNEQAAFMSALAYTFCGKHSHQRHQRQKSKVIFGKA